MDFQAKEQGSSPPKRTSSLQNTKISTFLLFSWVIFAIKPRLNIEVDR